MIHGFHYRLFLKLLNIRKAVLNIRKAVLETEVGKKSSHIFLVT